MTCSVVHQGRIYVIGGMDAAGAFTGATQVYDIARDEWTQAQAMPTPRFTDAVYHSGRIWAIGGWNGGKGLTTVETYSPAKGVWEKQPDLAFAQSAHHMAVVDGRVYSFGDFDRPERIGVYDPAAKVISGVEGTGFVPCRNNGVDALNRVVYVVGGNRNADGESLDLVQAFPVAAGQKRQAASR